MKLKKKCNCPFGFQHYKLSGDAKKLRNDYTYQFLLVLPLRCLQPHRHI